MRAPGLADLNFKVGTRHPNPQVTLRRELIDDASGKWFVGQLISAVVQSNQAIRANIWLSNTKPFELAPRGNRSSSGREKAR